MEAITGSGEGRIVQVSQNYMDIDFSTHLRNISLISSHRILAS
jgi:hypothetical protein